MISMKFLTRRVSAESTGDFPKNHFPATFGGHLDFSIKRKNLFMSETEHDTAILTKFCLLATFRKIHFLATFGCLLEFLRYLNFCVKHKNVFISERSKIK